MGLQQAPKDVDQIAFQLWTKDTERDCEYTQLAIDALHGNQVAKEELKERFTRRPPSKREFIPSMVVWDLVALALKEPPTEGRIARLRYATEVEATITAARDYTMAQTMVLRGVVA